MKNRWLLTLHWGMKSSQCHFYDTYAEAKAVYDKCFASKNCPIVTLSRIKELKLHQTKDPPNDLDPPTEPR
jgi:hypothetical protein